MRGRPRWCGHGLVQEWALGLGPVSAGLGRVLTRQPHRCKQRGGGVCTAPAGPPRNPQPPPIALQRAIPVQVLRTASAKGDAPSGEEEEGAEAEAPAPGKGRSKGKPKAPPLRSKPAPKPKPKAAPKPKPAPKKAVKGARVRVWVCACVRIHA